MSTLLAAATISLALFLILSEVDAVSLLEKIGAFSGETSANVHNRVARSDQDRKLSWVKRKSDFIRAKDKKRFSCSKSQFKDLNDCCGRPVTAPLFSTKEQHKCNPKSDPQLQIWIEEYVLNRIQQYRRGNAATLTTRQSVKVLCPAAEFVACVYEVNDIWESENKIFRPEVAHKMFSKKIDSNSQLKKAIDNIFAPLNSKNIWNYFPKEIQEISCSDGIFNSNAKKVSMLPLLMTQLLYDVFYDLCPFPKTFPSVEKKEKEEWCEAGKALREFCSEALFQSMFNGNETTKGNLEISGL